MRSFEELLLIASLLIFIVPAFAFARYLRPKINSGWFCAFILFFDVFKFAFLTPLGLGSVGPIILLAVGTICLIGPVVDLRPARLLPLLTCGPLWLLVAFVAYAGFSLTYSSAAGYGSAKIWQFLTRGLIPAFLIWTAIQWSPKFSWRPVLIVGAIFCFVSMAFGINQFTGRLSLPGLNPIWGARTSLIVLTVALLASTETKKLRFLAGVLAIASTYATQSRGPLLAFALALGAIVLSDLVNPRSFLIRKRAAFAYAGMALTGIALGVLTQISWTAALSTFGRRLAIFVSFEHLLKDHNYNDRMGLWAQSINEFGRVPFFGTGAGGLGAILDRVYPHNLPLEIACELGLIGIALWMTAMLAIFVSLGRNRLLQALFVQTIGYSLVSGDFGSNYEYLYVGFMGLALSRRTNLWGTAT